MNEYDVVINHERNGLVTIKADSYDSYEDGRLTLWKNNNKTATFAKGTWQYIILKKEANESLSSS